MDSKPFECFFKFNDRNFSVLMLDKTICVTFIDIYVKIKQIVKMVFNEDLFYETNEFVIFEDLGEESEGLLVNNLSQEVRHQSMISIKRKEVENSTNVVNNQMTSNSMPSETQTNQTMYSLNTNIPKHPLNVGLKGLKKINKSLKYNSRPNTRKKKEKEPISYDSGVITLMNCEKSIQRFHEIVSNIDIKCNFKGKDYKYQWKRVCQSYRTKGYKQYLAPFMCPIILRGWTQFYVEYYELLNGKIEANLQMIFDRLKVVHILDLTMFFHPNDPLFIRLKEISLRNDFKKYFKENLLQNHNVLTKETQLLPHSLTEETQIVETKKEIEIKKEIETIVID